MTELRQQLIQRADGKCERCGTVPAGGVNGRDGLVAHHLTYDLGNSLETLKLVCRRCHRQLHAEPGAPRRRDKPGSRTLVSLRLTPTAKRLLGLLATNNELTLGGWIEKAIRREARREKIGTDEEGGAE